MGGFFLSFPQLCLPTKTVGPQTLRKFTFLVWYQIQPLLQISLRSLDVQLLLVREVPNRPLSYLRFEGSDHRPLVTYFNHSSRRKHCLFRFDINLTKNKKILKLIKNEWSKDQNLSTIPKLDRCRRKIIKWLKENHKNSTVSIKKNQDDLESALSTDVPDSPLIEQLTEQMEKAYKYEEAIGNREAELIGSIVELATLPFSTPSQEDGELSMPFR